MASRGPRAGAPAERTERRARGGAGEGVPGTRRLPAPSRRGGAEAGPPAPPGRMGSAGRRGSRSDLQPLPPLPPGVRAPPQMGAHVPSPPGAADPGPGRRRVSQDGSPHPPAGTSPRPTSRPAPLPQLLSKSKLPGPGRTIVTWERPNTSRRWAACGSPAVGRWRPGPRASQAPPCEAALAAVAACLLADLPRSPVVVGSPASWGN